MNSLRQLYWGQWVSLLVASLDVAIAAMNYARAWETLPFGMKLTPVLLITAGFCLGHVRFGR